MGLSRTVPEMNGGFGRKTHFFPTPLFNAPVDGVLLVMAFRLKKRLMLLLVRCIFYDMYNRFDAMPQLDRKMKRQIVYQYRTRQ